MERKWAQWRQRDRHNVPNTAAGDEAGRHDPKLPDHTVDSLGCNVVYEGERIDADVIFVHGLRGHQRRTWTKNGVFWPKDLLPSTLPSVRVIMYGYDANFASLLQPISVNTVFSHSKNLVNDVTRMREGIVHRPILWVTHSLGGIICKDALEYSKQQLRISPNLCDLFASTYGIIFLGTPHRGSSLSTLGVIASRVVRATAVVNSDSTLLRALEQNSEVLTRISDAFSRMLALREVVVYSFAEELPMPGVGIVVAKDSAYIGDAFERTGSIHRDHRDICRFDKSPACRPELEKVLGSLKEIFGGARRARERGDLPKKTYGPLTELEGQCIQGFFNSDYQTHRARIPPRHEGTCEWFLAHKTFKDWSEDQKSSLLWISGNPGMGKTVLASYLVQKLTPTGEQQTVDQDRQRPLRRLAYFFCDNKNDEENTAIAILSGLLHQLVSVDLAFLRKVVSPEFLSHGDRMYRSFACLWRIFEQLTKEYLDDEICCIIDGIDECDESDFQPDRNLFLQSLGKLISTSRESELSAMRPQSKFLLKVIITSRPYESIRLQMSGFHNIRLKAEDEELRVNSDIELYIRDRIQKLGAQRGYSSDLEQKTCETLIRGANGQFLWVALMLKVLQNTMTSAVERRLRTFPTRLEDIYDRLLRDMPDGVEDILRWVVYAFRPLSVPELWVALNGAHESHPDTLAPRQIQSMVANIALYSPLIKIQGRRLARNPNEFYRESNLYGNEYADIHDDNTYDIQGVPLSELSVHLVHQTVKEYFLSKWKQSATEDSSYLLGHQTAHTNLAIFCVKYLLKVLKSISVTPTFTDTETEEPIRNDFMLYAGLHWYQHSIEGDECNKQLWALTCAFLTSPALQGLEELVFRRRGLPRRGPTFEAQILRDIFMSPLHMFVNKRMKLSAKLWLKQSQGLGIDDKYDGQTALHSAVLLKDPELLHLLLSYGADPSLLADDGHGGFFCSSLHLAIDSEYVSTAADRQAVTALLIDNGANLECADFNGDTALIAATEQQDIPAAKFLVERGANCNATNRIREPVLIIACQLKLHASDQTHNTAADIMAFIQLLLSSGADINCRDSILRTPLHAAIDAENVNLVKLLLSKGANVELRAENGDSPLLLACKCDDQVAQVSRTTYRCNDEATRATICRLLSQAGAILDYSEPGIWNPLHLAVQNNHTDIVRVLWECGADLEAVNLIRGTALHLACAENEVASAEMLLSCGANVDCKNAFLETPLHVAAGLGIVAVVKLLLDHGAAVNLRDCRKQTPLLEACSSGFHESGDIARTLLARGADATSRTRKGQTAGELRRLRGDFETADMLDRLAEGAT